MAIRVPGTNCSGPTRPAKHPGGEHGIGAPEPAGSTKVLAFAPITVAKLFCGAGWPLAWLPTTKLTVAMTAVRNPGRAVNPTSILPTPNYINAEAADAAIASAAKRARNAFIEHEGALSFRGHRTGIRRCRNRFFAPELHSTLIGWEGAAAPRSQPERPRRMSEAAPAAAQREYFMLSFSQWETAD